MSLLVSEVESSDERVRVIAEVEGVIEKDDPRADDLFSGATALPLDPCAASWIGEASKPERNRRPEIERCRCGVRETHNSLVAAPPGLAHSIDVRRVGSLAHRSELVRFGVEPDVAPADEDRELGPVDQSAAAPPKERASGRIHPDPHQRSVIRQKDAYIG